MATIQIALINASTVLSDQQVAEIMPALQTQVHQDFAPAWGIDADLTFVPSNGTPEAKSWWLTVLDNSDQAGALGYHDLTDQGLPIGKVFAATDMQYGLPWSLTTSHELLEMLADPDIDLTAFVQNSATTGSLYAYETCDACESANYGYTINGVLVSDFVFPTWFESFWQPNGTRFDYGNYINQPFQLLPGGYISEFDITAGSGWNQLTGEKTSFSYRMRPPRGSRLERRRIPRDRWLNSHIIARTPANNHKTVPIV